MSTATQEPSTALRLNVDPRQNQFAALLNHDKFQASLKAALPKHLSAAKLVRLVLGAFQRNPTLLECTPESVLVSIMQAAALGLEPDGVLGQGYLVPFWNGKAQRRECQFIAGYRGLIKLARQSGEVADVLAEVVFAKDAFDYELGLDQTLTHKRNDEATDPGPLKYVYAVARFRDGEKKFVVMNKREIDGIKAKSSSKNKKGELVGPWIEHEPEMWKKTAVRRLSKMLPMSVDVQRQVAQEELAETTGELVRIPELPTFQLPAPLETVDEAPEPGDESQGHAPDAIDQTADVLAPFPQMLASCKTVPAIDKLEEHWCGPDVQLDQEKTACVREQCNAARDKLRGGPRGERANAAAGKQKEMAMGQGNAP